MTASEQKKKAKGARNDLTLTDKLERVTQILSGPIEYTCTTYITCPGSSVSYPKTSQEVKWLNQLNYKNKTITSFNSKRCATCWICGRGINIYEMNTGKEKIYNKCGEDEHVLPPGVGNIFGLLYPSEYDTILNKATPIVSRSLRPSHQWCNRVKSGIILILGPDPIEQKYRINEKAMTKILEKAKNWLLNGKTVMLEPDYSFHNKKKNEIQPFINEMDYSMRDLLEPLCLELNRADVGSSTAAIIDGKRVQWTMYLLRLVFNCCIIGFTVIYTDNAKFRNKWKKYGGGGQIGGQIGGTLSSDDLNDLANFMVNPANICLSQEELLEDDVAAEEPKNLPIWQQIMNRCTSCTIDERVGAAAGVVGCCLASKLGFGLQTALTTGVASAVAAYSIPKPQTMERGGKNNKIKKYYYIKTKKHKKPKRTTKKYRKSRKFRGGNRIGGNNIGSNCNDPNFSIYNTNLLKLFPYRGGSAIPPERNMKLLQSPEAEERLRLEEEERQRLIEEERLEYENEIRRQNDEDDRVRENIQDDFINNNNNNNNPRNYLDDSDESDMERLSLSELGGSKQKNKRKGKKQTKKRRTKKQTKKRRTKGGELQLDDPYKNSEGPQY